ncbi:hypothetical protein [Ramlibacter tataouinensis]|uniref:Candidate membrane protein n=1 Tax=Ramlibacter tataouinensis (strain ATCC BAA-407 / DSM 14655 / LMG 21543 / TTB310) TaxID=365046 RepID=F5Y561_RAMTT|nr:hypothetical protein [Ramlibacter tataouinensis]AEG93901.1 candidate membrane protein [Ramlibacter tataouinensis TTB310]
MSIFASPRFLRHVLWADAASCLATGAAQLLLAPRLAAWLQLPVPLLVGTGAFLVAYAGLVAWLALREPLPRPAVAALVIGNLGWAVACVALLASGAVAPNALGVAWVLAQALCVAVLAELQWTGLRRAPRVTGWA